MKAVVAAFNQEKALVGAFSVLTNLRMELFQALAGNLNLIEIHLAASGGVEASPAGPANISSLPSFMKWLHQLELATFAI